MSMLRYDICNRLITLMVACKGKKSLAELSCCIADEVMKKALSEYSTDYIYMYLEETELILCKEESSNSRHIEVARGTLSDLDSVLKNVANQLIDYNMAA